MQFGQSWDEAAPDAAPIDLDRTISEVRRQSPDVLLLQEVEFLFQAQRVQLRLPQLAVAETSLAWEVVLQILFLNGLLLLI